MNNTQKLDSVWLMYHELKEMSSGIEKIKNDTPFNKFYNFFKNKMDTLMLLDASNSIKDKQEYEQITYELQVAYWHFKKGFAA